MDNGGAIEAIFFVMRTGCQWNALNVTGISLSSSAWRRCQEWTKARVFPEICALGLAEYGASKDVDRSWHSMDGAVRKAPFPEDRLVSSRPDAVGEETLQLRGSAASGPSLDHTPMRAYQDRL